MTGTEMTKLYDTLLSVPGMNENVRLNQAISRKQLLLLSQILEEGLLAAAKDKGSVLSFFPTEAGPELQAIIGDCLEKAGLSDLNAKLKMFNGR